MEFVCETTGESAKRGKPVKEICNPKGCRFYFTKPDSTPLEFVGFFQAANLLREARLGELRNQFEFYENSFPFWAIEAYNAQERAFRLIEIEMSEDPKGEKSKEDKKLNAPAGGAFAAIEAAQAQKQEKVDQDSLEIVQQIFSENPDLEMEILDYLRGENE